MARAAEGASAAEAGATQAEAGAAKALTAAQEARAAQAAAQQAVRRPRAHALPSAPPGPQPELQLHYSYFPECSSPMPFLLSSFWMLHLSSPLVSLLLLCPAPPRTLLCFSLFLCV